MLSIKYYCNQKIDLQNAQYRLKALEERKKMIWNITQPKVAIISEVPIKTCTVNDVFADYAVKVEEIEQEIQILKIEINMLQKYLDAIEFNLRQMGETFEQIFVLKYIDRLSIKEICQKTNYSQASVYRKLMEISQKLKMIKNENDFVI